MPPKAELKDLKEIMNVVKEVQGSIKDMVETFSKIPSGKHRGVSGDLLLTTKEKEVLKLIQTEQKRANKLIEILSNALYGQA